jgi:hypothetical protein
MSTDAGSFCRTGVSDPHELAAGDGTDDDQGFGSGDDCGRKRSVWRFVGEIFFAAEDAQEGAALVGDLVANGAAQHGVAGFEGVEDGALGDRWHYFQS